jgi:hypothetical protein
MINFDFDFDKDEFLNKHELAPEWPFRLIKCGPTRCGKTNSLFNFIFKYLYYNKIYVYAKDLTEDKYQYLQGFFEEVNKIMKE